MEGLYEENPMDVLGDPTPPPVTLEDLIEATLDGAALTYARNKKKGGSSGKKGSRYEDYYFAYKTACVASEYLGKPGPWPVLRGQILGFVDDVVVCASIKTDYYQLKNVLTISWTAGEHPLETDFAYQYKIATALGEPNPMTHLVVANDELRLKLEQSVPSSISRHSTVEFFPFANGSLNRVLIENAKLQDALRPLSKSVAPKLDELEGVFGMLIIAGLQHPDGAAVDEMLRSANRTLPNYLCSIDVVDWKQFIIDGFENTLAAIPGLTYAFSKGFFSWTAFGTSGTFPVDCANKQFAEFQVEVVQKKPMTFDDFEGLLP